MSVKCPNCGHPINVNVVVANPTEDDRFRLSKAVLERQRVVDAIYSPPLTINPSHPDPDRPRGAA